MCGEHSPCSGQAARSCGALSPGAAHLFPPRRAAQAARGSGGLSPGGCGMPFPSAASGPGSQGLVHTPPRARCAFSLCGKRPGQPEVWGSLVRRAFSLRGPSARRRSGLRKSSDRNRGLFAGREGVASLGLSLPLSPPPASYLQWGWGGSSLEFLSPFVLRTAGGVFRPVNFSLALPQFKKISL